MGTEFSHFYECENSKKMNTTISLKPCTNCGEKDFDRSQVVYYNKGCFCSDLCKAEDIRKTNLHKGRIDYTQSYVPLTLMMSSVNGRV
jgi:hypothetical protein